eukprot:gene42891-22727_t
MGPIHPRDKKPKGYSNGPTIAGCSMAGSKVTVRFNKTLLAQGGADKVK